MLNANTISQSEALSKFYKNFEPVKQGIPKKPVADKSVHKVLAHVVAQKGVGRLALMKLTGLAKETVRLSLDKLFEDKKISRVAVAASGKYTIYRYFEFGKEIKVLTINEQVEENILVYLANHGKASSMQLVKELKTTIYRVKKATELLRKSGQITTIKCKSGYNELIHRLTESVK